MEVQGRCLVEMPYPLGTTLFWGAVVPASIFLLLVFGHELWRRICPLSFLSPIPRALGLQRHTAKRNPRTGEVPRQLAKVPPDSWLARHYPALQFGWLHVGLCGRILFFYADRLVLAGWLLFTIAAAIAVGWLYGGKAWCQYFCPMASVQSVYSTPAGLLGSKAHQSPTPITQSMCRVITAGAEEQSACVACQQPCIDIDAERMYWARSGTSALAFEGYGYVGLVAGYFIYYPLYAGNWDYYFSGAWASQPDQLARLLSPGLYLFGQAIPVPRIVAVPLVLGACTWLGWLAGWSIEAWMRARARRAGAEPDATLIRHRLFLAATFVAFNLFFLFAGRPLLQLAPQWARYLFDMAIVASSTLRLVRGWWRRPDPYSRENLAERFRRQLAKLRLDGSRFIEGRSLTELSTDEVYVLARVLPGFGGEQRHEAYKGVVREAMAEGYVNAARSLKVLRRMRQELGISDDEHRLLLEELGVEDPDRLDPDRRRSLEDQVRLSGYRRSLERLLRLQGQSGSASALGSLVQRCSISPLEEQQVLQDLSPAEAAARRAGLLLDRQAELTEAIGSLHHPALQGQPQLLALVEDQLRHRQELGERALHDNLALLADDPMGTEIRTRLQELSAAAPRSLPENSARATLSRLAQDSDPTLALAAVALGVSLDPELGQSLAAPLHEPSHPDWVRQTAGQLQELACPLRLAALPELEKRVLLATSDVFRRTWADTLDALASHAEIRIYAAGELITEAGDTCRELLLLIEGSARVEYPSGEKVRTEQLRPGQVLDEPEVLSNSRSESTIEAEATGTRVMAVPVDSFDAMLGQGPDFARRVLALETRQLQRLTREAAGGTDDLGG